MPQTPLHSAHEALNATFTDFGGWTMPLKYGSELEEHRAVRNDVGIFDLSHMGEIDVKGPGRRCVPRLRSHQLAFRPQGGQGEVLDDRE